MHEATRRIAERLEMTVDGEDQAACADAPVRRPHLGGLPGDDLDHRRVLVDLDLIGEARGDPAYQRGGLDHHGARRVAAAGIVVRAGHVFEVLGAQVAIGLTERVEVPLESRQRLETVTVGGAVILAAGVEVRLQTIGLDRLAHGRDTGAVQGDLLAVGLEAAGVTVGVQLVRQVDHEAGVAAGGPPADPLRFQQHDTLARAQGAEAVRRRQAGETAADDHPIGRDVLIEDSWRRGLGQQRIPAGGRCVARHSDGASRCHRSALPLSRWSPRRQRPRRRARWSSAPCTDRGHGSSCRGRRSRTACSRRRGW